MILRQNNVRENCNKKLTDNPVESLQSKQYKAVRESHFHNAPKDACFDNTRRNVIMLILPYLTRQKIVAVHFTRNFQSCRQIQTTPSQNYFILFS